MEQLALAAETRSKQNRIVSQSIHRVLKRTGPEHPSKRSEMAYISRTAGALFAAPKRAFQIQRGGIPSARAQSFSGMVYGFLTLTTFFFAVNPTVCIFLLKYV